MLLIEKAHFSRKEVLKNLMTLFLHDLSEFNEKLELSSENGLFEFGVFEWFLRKKD
ncbi:hypothetical protein [Paenibacillus sp. SSG-1]|uniref:hypothetical protein n=1 Tax=Paenibacillus sp. SSG-1 TaxID=1443669 RepID=UPI0015C68CEC|nr:hypothetical protein [Paenibacillus sp. SSG-1]